MMTAGDDQLAFLGRGWSFPVRFADGDVALDQHEADVAQAIRVILDTEPGERVMRPDFGAGLRGLVFAQLSTTTAALVQHRVTEALVRWEPRINVDSVSVTAAVGSPRLDVDIRYTIRSTNTFFNLVYPFYLEEGA